MTLLGEGTFGSVVGVTDARGEQVALKRYRDHDCMNECAVDFVREVMILNSVAGVRGVVRMLRIIWDENPATVMPRAMRGALSAAMPIPWSMVRDYLSQLRSALALLHARGVMHRDVKPGNVLLEGSGAAVLCDFGSSVVFTPLGSGKRTDVLTTYNYAAPEMLDPTIPGYDARADIWSLGVLALDALDGGLAFPGKRVGSVRRSHEHFHARALARAASHCMAWKSMLSIDPRGRARDNELGVWEPAHAVHIDTDVALHFAGAFVYQLGSDGMRMAMALAQRWRNGGGGGSAADVSAACACLVSKALFDSEIVYVGDFTHTYEVARLERSVLRAVSADALDVGAELPDALAIRLGAFSPRCFACDACDA